MPVVQWKKKNFFFETPNFPYFRKDIATTVSHLWSKENSPLILWAPDKVHQRNVLFIPQRPSHIQECTSLIGHINKYTLGTCSLLRKRSKDSKHWNVVSKIYRMKKELQDRRSHIISTGNKDYKNWLKQRRKKIFNKSIVVDELSKWPTIKPLKKC